MSYPNPGSRRRRHHRRTLASKYEICFGSPGEVVETVNELLADGWGIEGDTSFFYSANMPGLGGEVYAAQVMVLYKPEPVEQDDDAPEMISERTQ